MTPWRRAFGEHRRIVVALVILAIANLAVWLFVVRPAEARAANVAGRARTAVQALAVATADEAAARRLVAGKSEADAELATFYDKVLPKGAAAARRLTYARLPALARQSHVRYEERQSDFDLADAEGTGLGRLDSRMLLEGDYADIRRFIYELETSPEFVIIDAVAIAESRQESTQSLTLQLSTYFQVERDGT